MATSLCKYQMLEKGWELLKELTSTIVFISLMMVPGQTEGGQAGQGQRGQCCQSNRGQGRGSGCGGLRATNTVNLDRTYD